ncbi:MAG: enoyl-CoA hydratase-related protein [Porticoccaceae bacterium]|nr:enoyl-CoA hydratase-related protein [Porticoccaceae bacterium]
MFSINAGVATITINRPDRLNAFTGETVDEIADALKQSDENPEVGVIVLTGAGERAFCVGGDIDWEIDGGLEGLDWELGKHIVSCRKPVIARVDGYAIGGGNHLAYFCDFTIATTTSVFGQNGPRVGSPAGGYVVSYLAGVIGHKRAREMWMLCRKYSAAQALEWGLVNAVVSRDQLDAEVAQWCSEVLALSPTCLATIKQSFLQIMQPAFEHNVSDTLQSVAPDYFRRGEQDEALQAFKEKRQPDFSHWRNA